jgi:hypothetical protein
LLVAAAHAQPYPDNLPANHPSIRYFDAPADDPVARLDRKLAAGDVRLEYRQGGLGYLPGLLDALGVSADSQALVFSKTSFQAPRIGPRNPRAIYFGDNVAVGYVRGGEVMEIAALDARQGIQFYTLETRATDRPRFARREVCLSCHQGPATLGVPGIFVGSVYPDSTGMPQRSAAIITDHRTPFADRWGGWYVNAAHGQPKDRSNAAASDPAEPLALEPLPRFNPAGYLSPYSDIVALMTLEHQTHMTNLLTRLGWLARLGADLEQPIRETVAYMLFRDEVPLAEPLEGASTFTRSFAARGPSDAQGRSLRDFDLKTRLFRYPLSYMINSDSFDALPDAIRARIYRELGRALAGQPALEILRQTKHERIE